MTSLILLALVIGVVIFYRRHIAARPIDFNEQIPELLDVIAVLIRSGYSPPLAVSIAHQWVPDMLYEPFRTAHTALSGGTRFSQVIQTLRKELGPASYPICDILISADRDGLPITSVLDQLSFHAHQTRRRIQDVATRQLPIRLLIPLTCCILPSFVLLTMVPLLVNSLASIAGQSQ